MKISNVKRLIKEQLPNSIQPWIDQLLIPINNAITQFTNAFANQITISDNMLGVVKTFTLKTTDFPFTFSHSLNVRPKILFIGQIQDTNSTPGIFTVAPYAQWDNSATASSVVIQTITGLDPTKIYNVTIVLLGS
jgi:hypothetical protein